MICKPFKPPMPFLIIIIPLLFDSLCGRSVFCFILRKCQHEKNYIYFPIIILNSVPLPILLFQFILLYFLATLFIQKLVFHCLASTCIINIFFILLKSLFVTVFSYSLIFHLFCRNYHFRSAIVIQILPLLLGIIFFL